VFSTLHTGTAAEAVERIVDVFEGSRQRQVLIQLAAVLRCVIAQQLVPSANGGLVAAREVLMNTPAVANIIRENNVAQLKSVIQTGTKEGMTTMETALKQLLKDGVITEDTLNRRTGRARKV
jgi:twitching motility protein PilT